MSISVKEHQKQLEKEIQEINQHLRMMFKVCIYTSFTIILITTINVILRGFTEGFSW